MSPKASRMNPQILVLLSKIFNFMKTILDPEAQAVRLLTLRPQKKSIKGKVDSVPPRHMIRITTPITTAPPIAAAIHAVLF